MKTLEAVKKIIDAMTKEDFAALLAADYDYMDSDKQVSKEGKKRLIICLKKAHLTFKEWEMWSDD